MAVEVIALKCPECSSRLSGFEKDHVFFCPACKTAWEFPESGKPEKITVSYARPIKRPDKFRMHFYLPFYLYRVVITSQSEQVPPRVAELLARLNKVYVAAYRMMRESYFGEMALIYTEAGIALEENLDVSDVERARIGSAVRAREEAQPYLKYYPLLIIDKRRDITDQKFSFETTFEKIWAVPFFDLGGQIQEGILGMTFPCIALEAIEDFREINY